MGALVTLDLADDAPEMSLPWIITFGPVGDDEEWEPVVCGPYERAHALALAETVVADEQLTAVVEPVLPHATVDEIRTEIESNRAAGELEYEDEDEDEDIHGSLDNEFDEHDHDEDEDAGFEEAEFEETEFEEYEEVEPTPPPSPEEIRAGFARIAARLTSVNS